MPRFRPAVTGDAYWVNRHLREADRQETIALGLEPLAAILMSLRAGPSWVCVDDAGFPFALFGQGDASPWMVGTDDIETNWRWFLRNTPEVIRLVQGDHPLISNAVDARNTRHVRWLAWAGFTLDRPITSPQGLEFIPFHRRHPCASQALGPSSRPA
ncbi:hypothetical protein AB6806_23870 [Bosea sp. RCC_152_1]|uniref:hypothetical protein n=1 Tax=Bosea sp. RCC_152_1 TaxID=3239228 RepID=UPI00352365D8